MGNPGEQTFTWCCVDQLRWPSVIVREPWPPAGRLLLPGATHQFIESSNDLLAVCAQRSDNRTKMLQGDGDDLERVKNNRRSADLEGGIEMPELSLAEGTGSNERHYNSTSVVIELGRLNDNNKRNCFFMSTWIPVDVELRHQSVECSSANDPCSAANLFHFATADRTACDFSFRAWSSRAR